MNYKETLDEAWLQFLAPRESNAPTVISTFAGAGGSSLGYGMAGFRELLAVEWDDHAVEIFKHNFPHVPVYHGDIAKLSVEQILQMCNLEPGQLDVFDGSPPCQGFSTAGKRDVGDKRNQLFKEYCRLLIGLKPKVFIMENVSGMVKGSMKWFFREILQTLEKCGYSVTAGVLRADWYGVPQERQRLIFIGVRSDLNVKPTLPKLTVPYQTTVWNAFEEMPKQVSELPRAAWFWKAAALLSGRTFNDNQTEEAFLKTKGSTGGAISTMLLLWNRASCTILKSVGGGGIIHPDRKRLITRAEMKRLQSFPDQYDFGNSTYAETQARIGNSVPPLMMRAIARHIRQYL